MVKEVLTMSEDMINLNYPKNNEIFTLTIAEPFTGLEMVRNDGFHSWEEWKFTREEIITPVTKRFKLVSIGYQPNFEAVQQELTNYGKIPQGQWRKAFKKAYPKAHGTWIGVADSSLVDPYGFVSFPCVSDGGDKNFDWADRSFNDDWQWLVEVVE